MGKTKGEKVVFNDSDVSIPTSLSLNGRIFISLKDHLDALVRIKNMAISIPYATENALKKLSGRKGTNYFFRQFLMHRK
jgi:hypothetical protein